MYVKALRPRLEMGSKVTERLKAATDCQGHEITNTSAFFRQRDCL